jgi:hypothetical protein
MMAIDMSIEPKSLGYRDLAHAEDDLEWWYTSSASDLGVHGMGYESVTVVRPDEADEKPGTWAVAKIASWRKVVASRRYERVGSGIVAMQPELVAQAQSIYTPGGYPLHLHAFFAAKRYTLADSPGVLSLVGAALRTDAFSAAFGAAKRAAMRPIDWADQVTRPRVEKGKQVGLRPPAWMRTSRDAAERMRLGVLAAYHAVRVGR